MDKPVEIVHRPATAHGWVERPDLGEGVWELPDDKLYKAHPHEGCPQIATLVGPPPFWGEARPAAPVKT